MSKIKNSIEDSISMTETLIKPKKEKKKLNRKGRQIPMKELLKPKNIKRAKKGDRQDQFVNDLLVNFPSFEKELKKFYGGADGKSKVFDDREDVVDMFTNKTFAKCLLRVLKEIKETDDIPYVVLYAIGDMYVNSDKAFAEDEKLSRKYFKVFDHYNNKRIKKLAKKMEIKPSRSMTLFLAANTFKGLRQKFAFRRAFAFLGLLYGMEDLTEKKVKLALESCYGKRITFILKAILNEAPKGEKSEVFSLVTNAALNIMNKMDKDDLKELLKEYAKRRKNNPKAPRRLALLKINEDDYKNIHKTIEKLIRAGFNKEIFM